MKYIIVYSSKTPGHTPQRQPHISVYGSTVNNRSIMEQPKWSKMGEWKNKCDNI